MAPGEPARKLRLERRRSPRRVPDITEPLTQVRLRTGRELAVVDVGDAGALVEGEVRLLPGTHLDVHVTTRNGRVLVRSRVSRAFVCAVEASRMRYRAALSFDSNVDTAPGYPFPATGRMNTTAPGTAYPNEAIETPAAREERLTA
jgi:hypothetical protein